MTEDNAPQIVAELRKWASLWADLLHVDMTLLGLRETPNTPSTVFVRRSLWEAAVIAYGRMTMSNRGRKVDFDDLLSVAGDRETHDRILGWRHGHVAHRRRGEFEKVDLVEQFDDAGALVKIEVVVAPAIGPVGGDLVQRFAAHIHELRTTLWERYLVALAQTYAGSGPTFQGQPGAQPALLSDADPARFSINLTLWQR
ncbi:hypothetical protein RBB84_02025 [Rhodococcus sp. D-6]|uniref:Uncharacterized protein n=1 Tax=Rhodococcus sp. D-6 TaxID=1387842 RepID=A0AAU7UYR6_9NOCA|nr:hypothetical protein [Rhodococcus sp. HS-D2]